MERGKCMSTRARGTRVEELRARERSILKGGKEQKRTEENEGEERAGGGELERMSESE